MLVQPIHSYQTEARRRPCASADFCTWVEGLSRNLAAAVKHAQLSHKSMSAYRRQRKQAVEVDMVDQIHAFTRANRTFEWRNLSKQRCTMSNKRFESKVLYA